MKINYSRPGLLVTVALVCASKGLAQDATGARNLEEIIVTANRQAEPLSKVPISVSAFSQEQMDAQGLKDVDDLVRYTPGLNLTRVVTGANAVAIRGISSAAGSGTTGIYIDDTPIQVRNLGYGAGTAFPGLFDLERVEVLRGPQGTLFGAGSEGGTIRFIQTQPSLAGFSTYARGEFASTRNGDITYEGGAAAGGPLVEGRLGFRVSGFYRREGGYIDAVNGNPTIVDPSGASFGDSVDFARTGVEREDTNWNRTVAARVAFSFAATENLTIAPSLTYQKQHQNDGFNSYWTSSSNPGSRDYSRLAYTLGDASTDPSLTPMQVPDRQLGDDEFYLPALAISWRRGALELVSNTSYFDRKQIQYFDFTAGYVSFYLNPVGFDGYARPGMKAMSPYDNTQQNFVQELRLQSADPASRLTWVAGVFYSHNKQAAGQSINVNFLGNAPSIGFAPDFAAVAGGAPYGPGSSAIENFQGIPLGPNSAVYTAHFQTREEQLAGFAQGDFKFTEKLKLTVGVRYAKNDLDFAADYGGPETNASAPFGLPCVPNTYCENPEDFVPVGSYAVGTGPFTPVFPNSSASGSETSFTPKVGLSYEIDDGNMLYATAAKGFRPGGASLKVPTVCNSDLQNFGYVDGNGSPTHPLVYDSDSVWSYEIGSKNRLLDGRLALDSSVYMIKWSNIQTRVFLPTCAYDFVDNLADATSRGFDLGFQVRPIESLTVSGSIGYTKATFDADALSPGGRKVYRKDASIPDAGAPWTLAVSGQYDFTLFGGRELYLRGDYTRSGEARRTGALDAAAPNYNPLLRPVRAYSIVNARLGVILGAADVSLFMDNVSDAHPDLALTGGTGADPYHWTNTTLRPRTYGVTMTYRY